jgi:hypothetical protein
MPHNDIRTSVQRRCDSGVERVSFRVRLILLLRFAFRLLAPHNQGLVTF